MQSRCALALQAECMGPPAPKNGAIRITMLFYKTPLPHHRLWLCVRVRIGGHDPASSFFFASGRAKAFVGLWKLISRTLR